MPGFNSQRRGTVRTLKLVVIVLCYRLYSCAVVIVLLLFVFVLLLFVLFYVLKLCVQQHCHQVLTQLQSSNLYSVRSVLTVCRACELIERRLDGPQGLPRRSSLPDT